MRTSPGTPGHLKAWFSQVKFISRPFVARQIPALSRLTSEGSLVRTQLRPPAQWYFDSRAGTAGSQRVTLVGFGPDGKRLRRKVSGKTKQEVRDKLKAMHAELDAGLQPSAG